MNDVKHHKRNFFNTAVADIYRAIDGKSHIGAFILTFCLIDYLTWLEFGGTSNLKDNYSKWVQKRLLPLNVFYTQKEEEFYSVRCALVHTYGPSKEITRKTYEGYELSFNNCGLHMQRVNTNVLQLCLYTMLTETVYAAHLFFEELIEKNSPEILDRLNTQIKILGSDPPEFYGEMHQALSVLDSEEIISLNHIRSDYTFKILYPDRGN